MDNKELIAKLKELEGLLEKCEKLEYQHKHGCALEALDRIEQLQAKAGTLPQVPSIAGSMPIFPPDGTEYKQAKADAAQTSLYLKIALGATAILFVIWLLSKAVFFLVVAAAAGFVSYWINKTHRLNKEGLSKKEKAYNQAAEESQKALEKYRKALASYEQEQQEGIEAARQYANTYRQLYSQYETILADFEEAQETALQDLCIAQVEVDSHDYIHKDYYHHIPKLIALLQSGRADDYKEALNMAIEEERQDAMEAARQEEEARRLAAMERQAEEERRHNMMMERQQAAHDRAMERTAQEQAQAQRRAASQAEKDRQRAEREAHHQKAVAESEARKQANATRMAGVAKCANCVNSRSCPSGIKESGAGLTCGSYRPR